MAGLYAAGNLANPELDPLYFLGKWRRDCQGKIHSLVGNSLEIEDPRIQGPKSRARLNVAWQKGP